jgi:hypothetical protein
MHIIAGTRIEISRAEDETLSLAGEELVLFLEKSPGARLVGTGETADVTVAFRVDPDEPAFAIDVDGDTIHFVGREPVEVLYAVYAFAESFLGFTFFEPGHDRLGRCESVDLCEGRLLEEGPPLLKNRGFIQEHPFTADNLRLADWMAKNRLNYLMTWMKYYDEVDDATKAYYRVRGITIESGHHNFDYWIPFRDYGQMHPEFFALRDGKRVTFDEKDEALLLGKQLCTTDPVLREEIVTNMVAYCRAHPEVRIISLIPNDGFGWCECERCSAFYDPERRGEAFSVSSHVHPAERIYQNLVQYVARRLREELPGVTLTFAAYVNYVHPAEGFVLTPGLAVHYAPYWRCINHDLQDRACPINRRYLDVLDEWAAVKEGGEINLYEYYMGVHFYLSLPMLHEQAIFDEVRALAAHGADGVLTQFHWKNWVPYGLNYYAMARACRGGRPGEVLAAWREGVFGEDADEAGHFYEAMRDLQTSVGPCLIPYPRAFLRRVSRQRGEEVGRLARDLQARRPDDPFRQGLVVWTEYLVRFKDLFDGLQAGTFGIEDLEAFLAWIKENDNADVFEPGKHRVYAFAIRDCLKAGRPWIHFNIDWEDAYVLEHDETLGASR